MYLGKLYKVKKYFWLMFPTKQTATAARSAPVAAHAASLAPFADALTPAAASYFSPDSYIVSLEEDGVYKNVLTSDGKIGWTWFIESYNDCFEEVEREEP